MEFIFKKVYQNRSGLSQISIGQKFKKMTLMKQNTKRSNAKEMDGIRLKVLVNPENKNDTEYLSSCQWKGYMTIT